MIGDIEPNRSVVGNSVRVGYFERDCRRGSTRARFEDGNVGSEHGESVVSEVFQRRYTANHLYLLEEITFSGLGGSERLDGRDWHPY